MLKYNILFFPDKEPDKSDGKLRMRVRWSGNIAAFNLGFRVDFDKWSAETQRCKNNSSHGINKIQASRINKEINRYYTLAEQTFADFETKGKTPTLQQYKTSFYTYIGKETKSHVNKTKEGFFYVFDLFTQQMGLQNNWTAATYTKFNTIKKHLSDFDSSMTFEKITDDYLSQFVRYMMSVPLRNSTIAKNVSFVR